MRENPRSGHIVQALALHEMQNGHKDLALRLARRSVELSPDLRTIETWKIFMTPRSGWNS